MHQHLFILGRKSDPDLLSVGEVVPLENHMETSDLEMVLHDLHDKPAWGHFSGNKKMHKFMWIDFY